MHKFYLLLIAISIITLSACSNQERQWTSIVAIDGSKPITRHEAAMAKVGDKIYLLGGRGTKPTSIYDTKQGRWTQGATPPIEIHHFQPVVYDDKIYVIGAYTGGWPTETPVDSILIYHPNIDQWSIGDAIPQSRRRGAAGAIIYNDKIYLAGGIKNGHIGDHKKWLDSYDPTTGEWIQLQDAPRARDHFSAVVIDDKLYLAAGRNTENGDNPFGNTIGEVDVYDLKKKHWNTLPNPIPTKRAGNAAIAYQSELVILGGESDTQEMAHREVEALNTLNYEWRSLPPMITGRHGTGVVVHRGDMMIASGCGKRGGEPELDLMEVFQ